ncbi:MAG: DMT family transporter [Pseudomonadota bacterium]|jgi:drug/metabolite transporter (DMT)-like permease|nr:MAG: EamA/RhaT family transporter [Pseudomonadota bacterium]
MDKPVIVKPDVLPTNRLLAIGLVMLAVTMFACLDGTAKYLVSVLQLPVGQVVWMRFFSHLVLAVLAFGLVSVPRLLRTRKLAHQLIRSVLMMLSTLFSVTALRYLRLDQTTTILFLTPLVVALLAGPFLGEWVGWRRLLAIVTGFVGVLVIIRPGFAAFHPAFLLALGCVLSYSLYILLTRYLAAYDTSEVTLLYSTLVGTVLLAPWAMVEWTWPADAFTWIVLISLGFWGGLGHYLLIIAHRWAPAPTIAPFTYVQLIAVTVIGYLVFGDLPDVWTAVGSAIIVASGIYLLRREQAVESGRS